MGDPGFGTFAFGLDEAAEERARRLHEESIVIDALFWGPVSHLGFTPDLEQRLGAAQARLAPGEASSLDGRGFAFREAAAGRFPGLREQWDASGITAGQHELAVGSAESLLPYASYLDVIFDGLPWLTRVRRAEDVREAKRTGGHALFLHCQPTEPISRDLRLIEQAHDVGLRILQLTYNDHDFVGAGCTDRSGSGLSSFGVRVVELLNELRIVVDVSHGSMRTVLDACDVSNGPVILTHTAARALYAHDRGCADEAIKAVAATGGTIGVVTVPFFLRGERGVDMNDVLDHLEHIIQLVGPEHAAIGTDWPLGIPARAVREFVEAWAPAHGFRAEHNITVDNVVGFDDYRDFPNFTRGLVARGYADDDIRGILGENFLRVFERVCG
jgi:membrane dipeptidase